MSKYEKCKIFDAFFKSPEIKARLGSGVQIEVDPTIKPVKASFGRNRSGSLVHEKPLPKVSEPIISEVDGIEVKVERTPLRYEMIEDIFSELPDFAQEAINKLLEEEKSF